jgi:hypothetical protein
VSARWSYCISVILSLIASSLIEPVSIASARFPREVNTSLRITGDCFQHVTEPRMTFFIENVSVNYFSVYRETGRADFSGIPLFLRDGWVGASLNNNVVLEGLAWVQGSGVFRNEADALSFIRRRVAPQAALYADEAASWNALAARFTLHRIDHGESLQPQG